MELTEQPNSSLGANSECINQWLSGASKNRQVENNIFINYLFNLISLIISKGELFNNKRLRLVVLYSIASKGASKKGSFKINLSIYI